MQPVGLPRALLDLRLAIARQVTQRADRLGRHETRPQQPGLRQLTQPRRVGDVGLAARHLLDVAGVDQQQLELVLQDRPHRLPIHAGGLHRDLRDPVRCKPITQRQQPRDRRRELRDVLLARAALTGRAHARRHLRLMNIQRPRALDDRLHPASHNRDRQQRRRPRASENWRV